MIIVPGYGIGLAAAQHQVRELVDVLQDRGIQVKIGSTLWQGECQAI